MTSSGYRERRGTGGRLNGNAAKKRNWRNWRNWRRTADAPKWKQRGHRPGRRSWPPAACSRRALARHDGPVQCWTPTDLGRMSISARANPATAGGNVIVFQCATSFANRFRLLRFKTSTPAATHRHTDKSTSLYTFSLKAGVGRLCKPNPFRSIFLNRVLGSPLRSAASPLASALPTPSCF